MLGILKKKTSRVVAEIKKFENRVAQAVINDAYLVAYADGECGFPRKGEVFVTSPPCPRLRQKLMRLAQPLSVAGEL